MSTTKPIYDRDEAPTDRITDVVLLLADEDGATYDDVREQLDELYLAAFPFDLDINVDEPIDLTERGRDAAAALHAGLDDDQAAALDEVISS